MIIADTHAWIWWVTDDRRLSKKARRTLDAERSVGVCAISVWEVAMLVAKGRLRLDRDVKTWVNDALAADSIELLPLTPDVALTAAALGSAIHADPADRMIIASALTHDAQVVTKDDAIAGTGIVRCVW